MKKINIAINGFGRIGRATLKIIMEKHHNLNIVAINDLTDPATLAHLLKYDSNYGQSSLDIKSKKGALIINKKVTPVFSQRDPSLLPWKDLKVDIVLECTGIFRTKEEMKLHLQAGAKKVILSAPAKDNTKTIVLGVNEQKIKESDNLLSNASCTTNCLAPITNLIMKKYGIKKATMTTIHAYTASQNIVDGPHKDLRRGRAAAVNIVPTSTGAAIAVAKTIPSLKGKLDGGAIRVPVLVGSLCDIVYHLKKKVNVEEVNRTIIKFSKGSYKGIIGVTKEPLVSSDIIGNSHSSIVDLLSTKVIGGDLLKIMSWYDNEWGYANRLVDLANYITKFIK